MMQKITALRGWPQPALAPSRHVTFYNQMRQLLLQPEAPSSALQFPGRVLGRGCAACLSEPASSLVSEHAASHVTKWLAAK